MCLELLELNIYYESKGLRNFPLGLKYWPHDSILLMLGKTKMHNWGRVLLSSWADPSFLFPLVSLLPVITGLGSGITCRENKFASELVNVQNYPRLSVSGVLYRLIIMLTLTSVAYHGIIKALNDSVKAQANCCSSPRRCHCPSFT